MSQINSPGAGLQTLAQVLALGNATGGTDISIIAGDSLVFNNSSFTGTLDVTTLTANRAYTLQDGTGTLAFLSDIPGTSSWADTLAIDNVTDNTGSNLPTIAVNDDLIFNTAGAESSRAIWNTAGAFTCDIFTEGVNGNIWRFRVQGAGDPDIIFDQVAGVGGINKFEIDTANFTIGDGTSGDQVINFNAITNDGSLTWSDMNNRFSINQTLEVAPFTVAGFVKNTSGGVLSGGESIDIGDDTNLTATSPIVLTGDNLAWDFTVANTWVGKQTFDNIRMEGIEIDTTSANGDIIKDLNASAGGILTFLFSNSGAGSTRLTVEDSFQVQAFTVAGFVKNNTSGIFSGGNSIDISDDTNLTATVPILLILDDLSLDFAHNFAGGDVWSGTHEFTNDHTITFNTNGSIFADVSIGQLTYTYQDHTDGKGINLTKTETIKPALTPQYVDVAIDRQWTGGGSLANLLNISLTDSNLDLTGGISLNRIFNLEYNRQAGSNSSVANNIVPFRLQITDSGTYSNASNQNGVFLEMTGATAGVSNSASTATGRVKGLDFDATATISNIGAGLAEAEIDVVFADSAITQFGTDTINFRAGNVRPNIVQISGVYNFEGYELAPQFGVLIGSATSQGFIYNPGGAAVATPPHIAFKSTRGTWHNQFDGAKSFYGAGDDVSIQYTGTIWEFNLDQATTRIDFNPGSADTDFRISGDTIADLFFINAGTDRVGLNTNAPAVLLDVNGDMWLRSQAEIRLGDSDNSHYVGWRSGATVTTNRIYDMPTADGSSGDVLQTSGAGVTSWVTPSSGGPAITQRTADQTIASVTYVNDNTFSFSVAASTNYVFRIVLPLQGTGSDDHALRFTGPASPNAIRIVMRVGNDAQSPVDEVLTTSFSTEMAIAYSSTGERLVTIEGMLRNNNAGTVQLQHRNIALAGGGSTLRDGAYMMVWLP